MKTNIYITIIIFLSVCYSAFTQSEINLLSNWDYKRKAKTYEKFNKVIASTNGYIIAVGETLGDSYKDLDGIFLVLDAEDGSQYLWKKFGGSGNQAFHSVVQNHDGTFTLVGYSQIGAKGDVDGWVVKLDLEGNVLFETKPQSMEGGNEELLDVAISDTGDILAIGMQKSNKSESIWAVNIGNEGIIKNFMMNNNFLGDVKSLTTATNGGFVLTGTTSEKNRNNPQDIWVTKIDKDGNDLWGGAKYFGDKGFQESKSITPTLQDGGFAIVGGTNSKGAGVSDIWVIKLDENGDLEWDKTFGGHAADVGAAITELSDGGLAVLGQTWSHMPRAQNSTLRLIIIDGRGNELDSENYLIIGGEGDEIAYSVVELLTNDNLVILGNTNPAKQDVFPTTYIGAITYKVLENNDSAGSKSDRFGSEQSGMLSLSSATLNDLNNNNFLESNERGYLELEITNTKTINLYNITANISGSNETSELGYWEKIKIGALKAGQKKKLFVPVYALGSLTAGTYEVNINLDVNGKYAASTKASIISNQPKPPYLAVQDSEFVPHSSPKAGQPIRFSVSLINKGGLPTPITEAYFELPKGVQALESQSIRIPAIKPEETYQLTFSFTYDQNFQRNVIDVLLQIKGQGLNSIFERYPLEIAPPALQNPNTRSSGDMMVWMSPDPDEQGSRTFATNDKDVDIKLKILTSRQLEKNRVSVYINGNKPQGQKADEVKLSSEDTALGRYNYQNKIRLKEGENKVKIVYHDENGNDFSSAELVFDYTPKDKPNLYVISIGVKHQDLEFTEKDANDFAKMYGQFRDDKEKKIFKKVEVLQATQDKLTTTTNIKAAFIDLGRMNIKDGDLVVIFISSHGKINHKGEFILMPSDYNSAYEELYSINFREDILDKLKLVEGNKLVFIDACHSGSAFNSGSRSFSDAAASQMLNKLIQNSSGLEIIASCGENEYSYEDKSWGNGAFTKSILEAFRGETIEVDGGKKICADIFNEAEGVKKNGKDGVITIEELKLFIQQRVPHLVRTTKVAPPTEQRPSNKSTDLLPQNLGIFVTGQNN